MIKVVNVTAFPNVHYYLHLLRLFGLITGRNGLINLIVISRVSNLFHSSPITKMGFDEDKAFTALKLISTGAAGMFAGGAAYINICEHPARMTLPDTKMCHKQWKESFDRAKVLQVRLALVTAASGIGAYYLKSSSKGIIRSLAIVEVVLFFGDFISQ